MAIKAKVEDDCDWSAVSTIAASLTAPAPKPRIIEWLTMLAVETASRAEDEGTSQLRFATLADRLSDYPGDVVRQTLRDWPESNTFFPSSWKELKAVIATNMGNRAQIADKIEQTMATRGALANGVRHAV